MPKGPNWRAIRIPIWWGVLAACIIALVQGASSALRAGIIAGVAALVLCLALFEHRLHYAPKPIGTAVRSVVLVAIVCAAMGWFGYISAPKTIKESSASVTEPRPQDRATPGVSGTVSEPIQPADASRKVPVKPATQPASKRSPQPSRFLDAECDSNPEVKAISNRIFSERKDSEGSEQLACDIDDELASHGLDCNAEVLFVPTSSGKGAIHLGPHSDRNEFWNTTVVGTGTALDVEGSDNKFHNTTTSSAPRWVCCPANCNAK